MQRNFLRLFMTSHVTCDSESVEHILDEGHGLTAEAVPFVRQSSAAS
jgi:hypothetical protein